MNVAETQPTPAAPENISKPEEKKQTLMPDAVPLFPKASNYNSGPPKSPLEHIKFIQLKRFQ
jgi:hypothetical protein